MYIYTFGTFVPIQLMHQDKLESLTILCYRLGYLAKPCMTIEQKSAIDSILYSIKTCLFMNRYQINTNLHSQDILNTFKKQSNPNAKPYRDRSNLDVNTNILLATLDWQCFRKFSRVTIDAILLGLTGQKLIC